jgi:hypothetical protein
LIKKIFDKNKILNENIMINGSEILISIEMKNFILRILIMIILTCFFLISILRVHLKLILGLNIMDKKY